MAQNLNLNQLLLTACQTYLTREGVTPIPVDINEVIQQAASRFISTH